MRAPAWLRYLRAVRRLAKGSWEVREEAVGELRELGGRRSVHRIAGALHDASPDVRIAAIEALMAHRAATPSQLLPLLHDVYQDWHIPSVTRPFPVRAAALDALYRLGWQPATEDEQRLVEVAERRSVANHRMVTYFLGAGFARAFGLPVAGQLGAEMVDDAWNEPGGLHRFIADCLGLEREAARVLPIEELLDAIERFTASPDPVQAAQARSAALDVLWWLRSRFDAEPRAYPALEPFLPWKPESPLMQRFFRFLVTNNQHNFLVTTNWDTWLDLALLTYLSEEKGEAWPFIDYGLYFADRLACGGSEYVPVHLFKMNGSADWFWCPLCRVIYGRYIVRPQHNFTNVTIDVLRLKLGIGDRADIFRCDNCGGALQLTLVLPSPRRPQHFLSRLHAPPETLAALPTVHEVHGIQAMSVLQLVAQLMSPSSLWVFMGYSLPTYDQDTVNLIRYALEELGGDPEIHVVNWEPDYRSFDESPVCRRYAEVLQRPFTYFPNGIERWIADHIGRRRSAHGGEMD